MNDFYIYRLYSGPKDGAYFTILSSAYGKILKNNVDQELSFNSWDISTEETLKKPKSAIFADSRFLEWSRLGCMVSLPRKSKYYDQSD